MTETQQHTPSAVAIRITQKIDHSAFDGKFTFAMAHKVASIVDEELAAQQEPYRSEVNWASDNAASFLRQVRELVLKSRELDSWLFPLLSDTGHRKQCEFRKALDAFKEVK